MQMSIDLFLRQALFFGVIMFKTSSCYSGWQTLYNCLTGADDFDSQRNKKIGGERN
jgi:hypothetical protein